jgi:predicted anti-sigma-YlaC factor YlaD
MKSNCPERENIFALSQGMLAEREARQAKAHLQECLSCRNVYQGYLRLDSVLDGWTAPAEPSPWFDARLRAALASAKPTSRSPGLRIWGLAWTRWVELSALTAMLLAAVVLTRSHLLSRHHQAAPVVTEVAQSTKAAAVQSEATQELKMYQNLPVLEDYDMLADFEVISELPKGNSKVAD